MTDLRVPEVITQIENEYLENQHASFPGSGSSFMCIYGSSVYQLDTCSDVDLFIAVPAEAVEEVNRESVSEEVRKLHIEHGRETDEEVPMSNKLIYGYNELDSAITYQGFDDDSGRIVIPPIRKEPVFLSSRAIKLRLALNALTTPNRVTGGETTRASRYINLAELAVTMLGAQLTRSRSFTPDNIQDALCSDSEGRNGEFYLGYKTDHPEVLRHMGSFIDRAVCRLAADGHLRQRPRGISRFNLDSHVKIPNLMHNYLRSSEGDTP